jgi:hypothetical protein
VDRTETRDMTIATTDGSCPDCGTNLTEHTWEQLPLLRGGGHGAARRTVLRTCPECGWQLIAERGEVRP